jgi:VCBS repeat-containing protein
MGTNPIITSAAKLLVEAGYDATGKVTSGTAEVTATINLNGDSVDLSGWFQTNPPGFYTREVPGYGSVRLRIEGSTAKLTFVLDNGLESVQGLAAGTTQTFNVDLKFTSGVSLSVPFTVQGSNDAPTLVIGAQDGRLEEDGNRTATVQLTARDPDTGDTATYVTGAGSGWTAVQSGVYAGQFVKIGAYGSVYLDANGLLTYVLDNAKAQSLAEGQTARESFTVAVKDGSGLVTEKSVSFSITGKNDAPVLSVAQSQDVTVVEQGSGVGGTSTASIWLSGSDPDVRDSVTYQGSGDGWSTADGGKTYTRKGTYGTATLDAATGQVTYLLDNTRGSPADKLASGQAVKDTFQVKASDGRVDSNVVSVSFDIQGTNDAPLVTTTTNRTRLKESGFMEPGVSDSTTSFTVSVDNGESWGFVTDEWTQSKTSGVLYSKKTEHGTLLLNVYEKTLLYRLDNSDPDVQGLKAGATLTESVDIFIKDNTGLTTKTTLNYVIEGTNDAPVISGVGNYSVIADGTDAATVSFKATLTDDSTSFDYDMAGWTNKSGTVFELAGLYGVLTFDKKTGEARYTPNDKAKVIAQGETIAEWFTLRASDIEGVGTYRRFKVDVTGVNDGTDFRVGSQVGTVTFGANGTPNGSKPTIELTGNDPDRSDNDTLTYEVSGTGLYGKVSLRPTVNGKATLTYEAYGASDATRALQGKSYSETFQVTVKDRFGATATKTVTFTVKGTNHNSIVTARLANDSGDGTTGTGSDGVTRNAALTGLADANSTVSVVCTDSKGNKVSGTATANGQGVWTFDPTGLADGQVSVTVKQANATGTGSASLDFTYDTKAEAPLFDQTDGVVTNVLTLSGTAEAGATVTVKDGDSVLGTSKVGSDGKWSFKLPDVFAETSHTLSVTQTDKAGNESGSRSISFTYDKTPPALTAALDVDTGTDGDGATSDPTFRITGEAGRPILVSIDGDTPSEITLTDGVWTPTGLSLGEHTLTFTQTDAANNTATVTKTVKVTSPIADAPTDLFVDFASNFTFMTSVNSADAKDSITFDTTGWTAVGGSNSKWSKSYGGGTVTWDSSDQTLTWSTNDPLSADGPFGYSVTHNRQQTAQGSTDFGALNRNTSFRKVDIHGSIVGGLRSIEVTDDMKLATDLGDKFVLDRLFITNKGSGTIGSGNSSSIYLDLSTIDNQGELTLRGDSEITGSAAWWNGNVSGFINNHKVTKSDSSTTSLKINVENNGSIVVDEGKLTISGEMAGTGRIQVNGSKGATLRVEGQQGSAKQTIDLEGEGATLALESGDQADEFIAGIEDFGKGDSLVFGRVAGAKNATAEFAVDGDKKGGTLTIKDGTGAMVTALHLFGQYTAGNFAVSSQGSNVVIGYKDTLAPSPLAPPVG